MMDLLESYVARTHRNKHTLTPIYLSFVFPEKQRSASKNYKLIRKKPISFPDGQQSTLGMSTNLNYQKAFRGISAVFNRHRGLRTISYLTVWCEENQYRRHFPQTKLKVEEEIEAIMSLNFHASSELPKRGWLQENTGYHHHHPETGNLIHPHLNCKKCSTSTARSAVISYNKAERGYLLFNF